MFKIRLPYGPRHLVSVTRDRLYVVAIVRDSGSENSARFRYIQRGGERNHFPVDGVALLELTHDGVECARRPEMLVHRLVGDVGMFWHGPPRPGIVTNTVGAHGWDVASGRKLWSFPALVALSGRIALAHAGEKARAMDFGSRYVIADTATGTKLAELDGRELVSLSADDQHAYVMDRGGPISAYRLADGAHLWTTKLTESRDRPTLTSFGLALGDECVWYASNDGAVGLDPATGAVTVRHPMKEYFSNMLTTERGAISVRQTKIDLVTRSGTTRIADVAMGERRATTNGRWLVACERREAAKDLIVVAPDGAVSFLKLATAATAITLGEEHVALELDAALVVVALADLADPKQKTLTFADGTTFANRAPLPKLSASAPATRLAEALTTAGLLPEMAKSERTLLLLELFGRDPIPKSGAAQLLQAVGTDEAALDRGFFAHDWRFGQETSDVIAEFDRALGAGSVRLTQTRNDATGLAMRMAHGTEVEEASFPSDVSLADIARRIDDFLAKAASPKRIYELETDGDGFAFLIVEKTVIATLREAKVQGIRR